MTDTPKPYRVLFSLKWEFYDAVLAGTKTTEYRRDTPRWRTMAGRAMQNPGGGIAVLQCGRLIHRRRIMGVESFHSLEAAKGRPPREQEVAAAGTGPVIAFYLGEVVP